MNTIICHLVGGDAFFSGLFAIAAGAFLVAHTRERHCRVANFSILAGWLLVIASAAAISIWNYLILVVLTVLAVFANLMQRARDSGESASDRLEQSIMVRRHIALYLAALGTAVIEFTSQASVIQLSPNQPLFVVGDSLSAGINDNTDIPWPNCLDEMLAVKVTNHARAGATCRSAVGQLEEISGECVVIVEIGGNDLLSGRTSKEFHDDLDALLTVAKSPTRRLIMFELPLPPLFNGYDYAQRELAIKHEVALIPRHLLAGVLFSENATLDSIHLSNEGHVRLAERIAHFVSHGQVE